MLADAYLPTYDIADAAATVVHAARDRAEAAGAAAG